MKPKSTEVVEVRLDIRQWHYWALVVLTPVVTTWICYELWYPAVLDGGALSAIFIITPLLMLFTLPFRFIGPQAMLVECVGDEWYIREVIVDAIARWDWDPRLKGTTTVSFAPGTVTVRSTIKPITANPKVRDLDYTVTVGTTGRPEATLSLFREMRRSGFTLEELVRFHLYNMQELRSADLGAFFNPLDKSQQDRFAGIVRESIGPWLAVDGMFIESAEFNV